MRPILAPSSLRRVVDERRDDPVGPSATLRVMAVEHDAHDVMHLAHTDDEGADEVETGLLTAAARHLVLAARVRAGDFRNRREEQVRSVGKPVNLVVTNQRQTT